MTRAKGAFGTFEAEEVEQGRVKLAGGGELERPLAEGERVILIVKGYAGLPAFERDRDTEELRRVDTIKAAIVLEPELPPELLELVAAIEIKQAGEIEGQASLEEAGGA